MITKTFELRDRHTFIPVLAIRLLPECEADRYLLARAGYGIEAGEQSRYIQVCRINGGGGESQCDPWQWSGGSRTMRLAHNYLIEHFDALDSGSVIDIEFLLGETSIKKTSESDNPYDV